MNKNTNNTTVQPAQQISAGTIARTIILVLAAVNQILSLAGMSPLQIPDETIGTVVSGLWTIVAAAVAWWKNNSFTQAARAGDVVMNDIKKGGGTNG